MTLDDCFELGYIIKAHGTQGEVYLHLETDYPEEYYNLESIFLTTKEGLVPFFLEYSHQTATSEKLIVKFEEINSRKEAESIKASKAYLPLSELPELEPNQFYYHDIMGYKVIDELKGEIGIVKDVYEMPGDDMLSVEFKSKEILIPLSDSIFQKIDKSSQIIHVNCPEGLIDIYLSNTKQEADDED